MDTFERLRTRLYTHHLVPLAASLANFRSLFLTGEDNVGGRLLIFHVPPRR